MKLVFKDLIAVEEIYSFE